MSEKKNQTIQNAVFPKSWPTYVTDLFVHSANIGLQPAAFFAAAEFPAWVTDVEQIITTLENIRVDRETICAAIIYQSFCEQSVAIEKISQVFGQVIGNLYAETERLLVAERDGFALKQSSEKSPSDSSSQHMMLLSMMSDVRVVFILLAYQLLRLRKAKNASESEKHLLAQETQDVFAPLANRLGIGQIKWELEDFTFRYLEPKKYQEIATFLEERRIDREQYIQQVVTELQQILQQAGIPVKVYGRPKHIYSIWRKMQKKHLKFDELYDVRAVRVLVDDLTQCYTALSVVHSHWPYVAGEYDDYIAAPKRNLYQSLHTAVMGPDDKVIEIQIRTQAMDEHAELGVAAHWRYKEGSKHDREVEQHIESIRSLLSVKETRHAPAVMGSQQTRPSPSRIYVLTPQGSVINLPNGATPLDFAYHVHTDLGHRCRGARVDGHMVPLTTQLSSGQQVEIISSKKGQPSRDWLISHYGYLNTPRARAKVRHWFKQQFKEEHMTNGRNLLARGIEQMPIDPRQLLAVANKFNFNHVDELYAAIGRGELGVVQIANLLTAEKVAKQLLKSDVPTISRAAHQLERDIEIEGVGDLLTTLARCCKPMSGDAVVGFVTQGRGVSVHRADCVNVSQLEKNYPERILQVAWSHHQDKLYEVDIEIDSVDRSGLLRDITSLLAADNINVLGANTRSNKRSHEAKMYISLQIKSNDQLNNVVAKLMQLRGVYYVARMK